MEWVGGSWVPQVHETARKHRIADADAQHAWLNFIDVYPTQGDLDLTMYIGPSRDGNVLLEVGTVAVADDDGNSTELIWHAMKARAKYLDLLPKSPPRKRKR